MQTTVEIEVLSDGDDATLAREASAIAVANADIPDEAAVPKTPSASAVVATRSGREYASNDIGQPGSAATSKDRHARLQNPVQRHALRRRILATVNGTGLTNVKVRRPGEFTIGA
jgi:hypothetical protein